MCDDPFGRNIIIERKMHHEAKEKTEEKAETTGGKEKTAKAIPEGAIGIIEIKSLSIRYPIFEGAGSASLTPESDI